MARPAHRASSALLDPRIIQFSRGLQPADLDFQDRFDRIDQRIGVGILHGDELDHRSARVDVVPQDHKLFDFREHRRRRDHHQTPDGRLGMNLAPCAHSTDARPCPRRGSADPPANRKAPKKSCPQCPEYPSREEVGEHPDIRLSAFHVELGDQFRHVLQTSGRAHGRSIGFPSERWSCRAWRWIPRSP